ncbi:MAG: DUF1080 domain-containing protein [Planctomycetota bacterium]
MKLSCSILGLTCWLVFGSPALADDWTSLFDGSTLAGWTQRNGTATYRVEDGAIVGRTAEGSPNSFLCSGRDYGDFELTFEVKLHDDALNSGVQIRSQTRGSWTGRINGPQVEIAAAGADGGVSGYLYGEAAGGWMTPDAARELHPHFKNGEWNTYRVLAEGPRIRVWINDALISDLVDEAKYRSHRRGVIGLQVHAIPAGQGPYEVSWRNLKLREISAEEIGYMDLFNGKDLSGWETSGNWQVQDGELVIDPREGEQGWQRFGDYLWTKKRYRDFILDLEYAYPEGGNSGVFFRVDDRDNPVATGIEAQILDSSQHDGEMTHHDHGGIIATVGASKNMSKAPGEWNRMIVVCQGDHLAVDLNGERIIDVDLGQSAMKDRPKDGFIGLQDHGRPHRIRFRHVRIKELNAPISLIENGLEGWYTDVPAADGGKKIAPSFVIEDGVLISRGSPQGHLITEAPHADYRLTVEYRWSGEPGNCGVLVHSSTPRRLYGMFPQSIECQLFAGNAGDFWCIGEDVSVPDMEARRGDPENWGVEEGQGRRIRNLTDDSENEAGQWNTMVIECRGDRVTVWVNGDLVNDGFDCTARSGQIAIQAEGAPCELRKVELRYF